MLSEVTTYSDSGLSNHPEAHSGSATTSIADELGLLKLEDKNNRVGNPFTVNTGADCSDPYQCHQVNQASNNFFETFEYLSQTRLSLLNNQDSDTSEDENIEGFCFQVSTSPEQAKFLSGSDACYVSTKGIVEQMEVKPKLKPEYPLSLKNWLECASKEVSAQNPPLVLLLDLDESVLSTKKFFVRINTELGFPLKGKNYGKEEYVTVYIDENAFKQLAAFSRRGHRIHVMTTNTYVYEDIHRLFEKFEIALPEDNYHNRETMLRYFALNIGFTEQRVSKWDFSDLGFAQGFITQHGFTKPQYFEKFDFLNQALLYDDKTEHESEHSFYIQAEICKPFPDLSAGKNSGSMVNLLANQRYV
ncbi:hypothetical protein D5018_14055 [Parashewanella curva]|uniref:Uncharacterized protein n=1 Tax=Parashewanella curva TaxID=2338552 RepID=A0A3L8PUR6_9GAMM|nr:hypothetical protein [Parashewanella curva]RLV59070.1 hypothetical protein D5018_14055 [Parashewanella curva]